MSKFPINKLSNKVSWARLRWSYWWSIEIQDKSEYFPILSSIIHIELVLVIVFYVLDSLSELEWVTHNVEQECKEKVSQCVESINFSLRVLLNFKQHVVAIDGHIREVTTYHPCEVQSWGFPNVFVVVGDIVLEVGPIVQGVDEHIHAISGGWHSSF